MTKDSFTFSEPTVEWLGQASLEKRKANGQYMTPRELAERLVEVAGITPGDSVLDPAAGTGELLKAAYAAFGDTIRVTGWELDETVIEYAKKNLPSEAVVEATDSLKKQSDYLYDVVLGNPPFYEFIPPTEIKKKYDDVIKGRANTYALFFKVGLSALKPGGRLAYIVPPSMNTGAYFDRLREFILKESTVESLEIHTESSMFDQANVTVQIIVLKKRLVPLKQAEASGRHVYLYKSPSSSSKFTKIFFCEDNSSLEAYFTSPDTYSLHELGYVVKTGTVTWNQRQADLHNDSADGDSVVLVWSKDISQANTISYSPAVRYRYVRSEEADTGEAIVTNRIVGAVGKGSLRFAFIPQGERFLAENHVNVIVPDRKRQQQRGLAEIYQALCRQDFSEMLSTLTGSTQLSSKELNHLLRFFL